MIKIASFFVWFLQSYNVLLVKHFLYLNVLRRHRFFNLCTRAQILLHLLYLIVNIFCNIHEVFFIKKLNIWTKTLSLINMIFSYFDYHLSFVNDILNFFIINYRQIHASIEALFILLGLCHAVVNAASVTRSIYKRYNRKFRNILIIIDRLFKKKKFILINFIKVNDVI